MSERTHTARLAAYTFTKPEGLLAHYTTAATAFEHILPRTRLRLGPYHLMRDPAENQDIQPSTKSSSASADDAIQEAWSRLKYARDQMRVLSFTLDSTDRADPAAFGCCWSRPRMWEQYGNVHRGVCLLFDRQSLERAIQQRWSEEETVCGRVDYARDGGTRIFTRLLNADSIVSAADPALSIAKHIKDNRDVFFFVKSDDFATEHEHRIVLMEGAEDYAFLDYGPALAAVVLGARFPKWQRPAAIGMCSAQGIRVGLMTWDNGCPRVARLSGEPAPWPPVDF